METEILARKALDILKSKWGLPQKGFLAGGSLANTIWELHSGNPAIVNDIDIFLFEGKIDNQEEISREDSLFRFKEEDVRYYEDYTGMCWNSYTKDFYTITSSEKKGIFNEIGYKASTDEQGIILNSFDINATRVGYSIEEDKFYITKDFEEFLKTGELKFTNLNSPHHSAIRILKKRSELNAKLDDEEFKLCVYAIQKNLSGITRRYFTDKYANIFINYQEELGKYFNLVQDEQIPHLIKLKKNIDLKIFTLEISQLLEDKELFPDLQKVSGIWRIEDFLLYKRYIEKSTSRKNVWSKVNYLFSVLNQNYLDEIPNNEDLDLLYRTTYNAANIIKNIETLTISRQIILIKKLFAKFNMIFQLP
jgi:hypothetical protein